jgi:alginate O-acetyltransferase complex protein AlgI
MSILTILILAATALLLDVFTRGSIRRWSVLLGSVVCLFWLQPSLPIRYLDFWLPILTIFVTSFIWVITLPEGAQPSRADGTTGAFLLGTVLVIALSRYTGGIPWITPSIPPSLDRTAEMLLPGLLVLFAGAGIKRRFDGRLSIFLAGAIILLIVALIVLKSPALSLQLAQVLRQATDQDPTLGAVPDIRWIGFSYICFRLIHVIRERMNRKLGVYDLRTFVSYVIFFPSIVAGPIDRVERFAQDYHQAGQPIPIVEASPLASASYFAALVPPIPIGKIQAWFQARSEVDHYQAFQYLFLGLFKKFVLADALALVALNPTNALQVRGAGWLWLLTYLYAFQIYFDFAGYTDIAIGLGLLLGIRLPDNFAAPYLKTNLTQFWTAWHISLTQWVRVYYFFPLVRWMRSRKVNGVLALFIGQVTTMLIIGVWHGVTWNFLLWGLWHGLGQFVQNRWSEWTKPWFAEHALTSGQRKAVHVLSLGLTFNYVALGWVWFVLPTPVIAGQVFMRLFGIGFS